MKILNHKNGVYVAHNLVDTTSLATMTTSAGVFPLVLPATGTIVPFVDAIGGITMSVPSKGVQSSTYKTVSGFNITGANTVNFNPVTGASFVMRVTDNAAYVDDITVTATGQVFATPPSGSEYFAYDINSPIGPVAKFASP